MIRVLLVEDQVMIRTTLAALLTLEDDIDVVAAIGYGDEVVAMAHLSQPDVALLDIGLPGGDGFSVAAALTMQVPSCRIIILTTFGAPGYLRSALESGAVGFLLKEAPSAQLVAAIRRAVVGERSIDSHLALATLNGREENEWLSLRARGKEKEKEGNGCLSSSIKSSKGT